MHRDIELKKFINEINKNINLEMNLPEYANYLMELYNKRAAVEFAMDYYTFQGMMADNMGKEDYLTELTGQFDDIIKTYVVEVCVNEKREEGIKKIDALRNQVYKVVEVLAAYADIFSRYEYVTNRCEYLFREPVADKTYTDEDFTREIMQYIFSEEENAVINSKICEIIAELPLRLTKNKFFELLSDGLSVYSGTDKETIDDFIYVLQSSSMLTIPEGLEKYAVLREIYDYVKDLNYAEITEEQFHNAEDRLRYAADYIEQETNILMMLQGLINKAYVMIIAAPYVERSQGETDCAMKIIEEVEKNFFNSEYLTLEDDITDKFVFLEGVPEDLQNIIQSVEYVLDTVKNNHLGIVKNIMADNIYQGLFVCENLLTDSLFIDLSDTLTIFDEKKEKEESFDITEYLNSKREELMEELMTFFKNNQKQVNRSVMALIISRLPVFFNNITEVQDYVYNSLSNCTNKAEKQASIEIIKCIMEN